MVEYYDKNGHLIEEGAYLLYENDEYFSCGIAGKIDKQLCFVYVDDDMAEYKSLCELDLSNIQILDIPSFNASFDKQNDQILYYDKFGLLIREEMSFFGATVEKKNNDLVIDVRLSWFSKPIYESLSKYDLNNMAICCIPKQYLQQVQKKEMMGDIHALSF